MQGLQTETEQLPILQASFSASEKPCVGESVDSLFNPKQEL
jgi:hypothetical protein